MKKTLCDRCGTEIKNKDEHWVLAFKVNEDDPLSHDYSLFEYDVCPHCVDALRGQLRYNDTNS